MPTIKSSSQLSPIRQQMYRYLVQRINSGDTSPISAVQISREIWGTEASFRRRVNSTLLALQRLDVISFDRKNSKIQNIKIMIQLEGGETPVSATVNPSPVLSTSAILQELGLPALSNNTRA